MPNHKTHRQIDKLILGKEFPKVHEFLDKPAAWVKRGHRRFRHGEDIIAWVFLANRNAKAAMAAKLHLLADKEVKANQ